MPGWHIVFLCCAAIAQPASAEMYTWTDDQGAIHFSDEAPVDYESEPVDLSAPSVVPMSENIRAGERVSDTAREIKSMLAQDRPTRSSPVSTESSANQKRCDALRQKLDTIQQKLRSGYSNDRGNRLRRQRRELSQRYSRECVLG